MGAPVRSWISNVANTDDATISRWYTPRRCSLSNALSPQPTHTRTRSDKFSRPFTALPEGADTVARIAPASDTDASLQLQGTLAVRLIIFSSSIPGPRGRIITPIPPTIASTLRWGSQQVKSSSLNPPFTPLTSDAGK
jgi:hypothetical protein